MASARPKLTDLANRNELQALDSLWLEAIEAPDKDRDGMLEALAVLNRNGHGQQAAALAWMWLATEQERSRPEDLLDLVREMIVRCEDSDDLRRSAVELYRRVYAGRPEIQRLIEVSGLSGGKSVRRALRTLDICLKVRVGDFLVARSDERTAKVTAIDTDTCLYTIRTARGDELLDADALALAYDVAEPNDFRVLLEMDPARIRSMIDEDPTSLILGILRRRGRIDSDELAHLLSPRFIPANEWKKWWSRTKADLKRCPNIVVEGKARTILTYHAEGLTLEEEILPQWTAAQTPLQRMAVLETYFREVRTRRVAVDAEMVERLRDDLQNRINLVRARAPAEALAEALVRDRLAEQAGLPEPGAGAAREILAESPDVVAVFDSIEAPALYLRAISLLKEARPQDWPELFARLLPRAPREACDPIAKALAEAGRQDLLDEAVRRIPEDFTRHLDAVCWLWRGPEVPVPECMPPREILLRLLDHLGELTRADFTPPEVLKHARSEIRASLSAAKYARFREVISAMDPVLASTVHRTIDRLDGLGEVVHADLLRIIIHTHPELVAPKRKADPWTDENTIYCTQAGMSKRQEELNYLKLVKIPENAKAIGEAAARGDLSENSEYKFALEERDLLQARVMRIQNELAIGRLLTATDISTDEVNIGTRVTLQSEDGTSRRELVILGPWEADVDKGIYNYRAPMCMKLRGLRVGDTVELDLDSGQKRYRIEAIANALERGAS